LPEGLTPIPPEVPLPPKLTLEILELSPITAPKATKKPFAKVRLEQRTETATPLSRLGLEQRSENDVTLSKMDTEQQPETGTPLSKMGTEQQADTSTPLSKAGQGQLRAGKESRVTMLYEPPVEPDSPSHCEQIKEDLPEFQPALRPANHELPPPDLLPFPDPTEVQLIKNRRITPESHWQDVRELTFIMDADFDYDPGETVTIFPKNFADDVQALIDLQGWNGIADKYVRLKPQAPDYFLDEYLLSMAPGLYPLEPTTFRDLLIHNLDITAIPKRAFFEMIAWHAEDPMHRDRLLEFTNPIYYDEFHDYTTRPRRSILEVLQDFPSVRIPWKLVACFFPIIRGRAYSIASGGSQKKYMEDRRFVKFQIIVALVKYRTVLKKVRQGLCSRYIASLPEGTGKSSC